jgi:hypothetical protein
MTPGIELALVNRDWDGAVGTAEDHHNDYLNRGIASWRRFTFQHGAKLQLWNVLRVMLEKGSGGSSDPVNSAIDGVGSWNFDDTSKVKESMSLPKDLTYEEMVELNIDLASKSRSNTAVDVDVPDFLAFGREALGLRLRLEWLAREYVGFLKTGAEIDPGGRPVDELPHETKYGTSNPESTDNNPFFTEFTELAYPDQVGRMKELTTRLSSSETGKEFLATLFDSDANTIFTPLAGRNVSAARAFVDPPTGPAPQKSGDSGRRGVTITQDRKNELFVDEEGVPRIDPSASGSGALAHDLARLMGNLLPGLVYRLKNLLKGGRPDSSVVSAVKKEVAETLGRFWNLYITNDQINTVVQNNSSNISGSWALSNGESWDWSAFKTFINVGRVVGAHGEFIAAFKGASKVDEIADDVPSLLGALDVVFSITGAFIYAADLLDGSKSWEELVTDSAFFLSSVAGIKGLEGVVTEDFEKIETKLNDRIQRLSQNGDIPAKYKTFDDVMAAGDELSPQTMRKLTKARVGSYLKLGGIKALAFLDAAAPILDTASVYTNFMQAWTEWSEDDMDAMLAKGLGVVGASVGVLGGIIGGAISLGWVSAAALPAVLNPITLALASVALMIASAVIYAFTDDSKMIRYIKHTAFGTNWTGLSMEKVENPSSLFYRFKRPTSGAATPKPHYPMQLSTFFSIVHPLNITEAEYETTQTRVSGSQVEIGKATIAFNPLEATKKRHQRANESTSGDLNTGISVDGMLYFRPIVNTDDGYEPRPPVHRIWFEDYFLDTQSEVVATNNPTVKTALDLNDQHGLKWSPSNNGLDKNVANLQQPTIAMEETKSDQTNLSNRRPCVNKKEYVVRYYDPTASTGSDGGTEAIFGVPDSGGPHYLELVYVPSEAMRHIPEDAFAEGALGDLDEIPSSHRAIAKITGVQ